MDTKMTGNIPCISSIFQLFHAEMDMTIMMIDAGPRFSMPRAERQRAQLKEEITDTYQSTE